MASLPTLQVHRLAGVLLESLLRMIQICLMELRLWKRGLSPAAIFIASLTRHALQLAVPFAPVLHMLGVESLTGLANLATFSFTYKAPGIFLTGWTAPLRLLVVSEPHSI